MLKLVVALFWAAFTRPVFMAQEGVPFNVDLHFPVFVPSEATSSELASRNAHYPPLFGSSILVASQQQSNLHTLLVGTPNLVSKTNSSFVPGGVYRCALDFDRSTTVLCNEILINGDSLREFVPRNRSLLGFNLGKFADDPIVCAPNWVSQQETPEGLCVLLDKNAEKPEFTFKMRITKRLSNNRPFESHSLFGFSLTYDEIDQALVVGIPGFNDFAGSISASEGDLRPTRLEAVLRSSKANTYTGFSVAFVAFGRRRAVLVGSPKHNKFNGKVDLVDLTTQRTIYTVASSEEIKGEFFGASLLVYEVTGANQKDFLVGAPLFSSRNRRETGRVYLFRDLQSLVKSPFSQQPLTITPKISKSGGHFGTTLASIDLNMDKFTDVIISAPFEDNSGSSSGAVYIYYGGSSGMDLSSEHRIGAEAFPKSPLGGFGYSLWTQSDVDNNGYNDLVIGSVLADKVSILRSIPIIELKLDLHFDRKGVNLTDTSTCLNDNACFRVNYCIMTTAKRHFPADLSFSVHLVVTDRKIRLRENRVIVDKISSVVTTRQNQICLQNEKAFYVEIKKKEEIYDIITPIEVQMTASLDKPSTLQFCAWCPVANPVTEFKEVGEQAIELLVRTIGFEHGCAKKVCVSRLLLETLFSYGSDPVGDAIVQGRFSHLEIVVDVRNLGESAIDTMLIISINPVVLLARNSETRCRVNSDSTGYVCEVNKLLQKDQKEHFKLKFSLATIAFKSLDFVLQVNSSSKIGPQSKITASKHLSIVKEASFELLGNQYYNYSFSDQTPRVLFPISFLVNKDGPSSVNSTYVQFFLPNDIIEIEQSSKYRCNQVDSVRTILLESFMTNGTLTMPCAENPEVCSKYECAVGGFESGSKRAGFDLTLLFHPSRISSKLAYDQVHFQLQVQLFVVDAFFDRKKPYATISTDVDFERQHTQLQTKSSSLIMIGGGGIGLLILIITVIVLIKNGFFKRKKREDLIRMKQRMSMNPNLFPSPIVGLEDIEQEEMDEMGNARYQ